MFSFITQTPIVAQILDLGLSLFSGFRNKDGDLQQCVHSPRDRSCWHDGFNINTDYEAHIPPGKLVEYDLTISNQVISPDGYLTNGTVINGQYPGPTIEADWGDTLRITVHNNLTNHNGTSIHWHGIRQFQTNYMDGVPGITQCPSKARNRYSLSWGRGADFPQPGGSQVYEFRAMQYGTAWYHSHWSLQYTNGALGPIHIRGPSSANYDVDLGPLLVSDWYHHDAFGLFYHETNTPHAALPVSTVLAGKGTFSCDSATDPLCTGQQERHEIVFEKGKKYKIGLVNTASLLTYKFWIDGHIFTVVETDLVPIKPYVTDVLILGIAQRYEVIIEANASFTHGSNFWIHAIYCDDAQFPVFIDSRIGIIRYNPLNTSDPHTLPASTQHSTRDCQDPSPSSLIPIVPRQVGREVNGFTPSDYLKLGLQSWPNVSDPHSLIHKWALANRTQYIDWRVPTLQNLSEPNAESVVLDPRSAPMELDYETGEWVYFVIENNYTLSTASVPQTLPRSVHPIHLHGHDFVILAQGKGIFDKDVLPKLDNPARRDVVNCPIGGWVWIAFQVNNPGAWLMHCHIAWHASAGLSLQFIEQRGKVRGLLEGAGVLPRFRDRCEEWRGYYEEVNIPKGVLQDDSGI